MEGEILNKLQEIESMLFTLLTPENQEHILKRRTAEYKKKLEFVINELEKESDK